MNERKTSDGSSPFEHPEVAPIFNEVMDILMQESDRGAVLVGTSLVDTFLTKLFREIAPSAMSAKAHGRLLEYPGPLSSLSAKADVAYATRLIGKTVHTSIHRLRKLRNDVAHSPRSFALEHHKEELRQMYKLGPGVPAFINELAARTIIETFVRTLEEKEVEREDERLFSSREHILQLLSEMPDAMATLQLKAYRMELGLAVGLICASLAQRWERIRAALPEDKLIL